MSCPRYSELLELVQDSIKTSLSLRVYNQGQIHIFVHCVGCEWYAKCYSHKELEFFKKFNEPGITPYLCLTCSSNVYKLIGGEAAHSERVHTLLNRSNYWGVLDKKSAGRLRDTFKSADKCGSFLWEVQETFAFDKNCRALLIAVTHVRYSTNSRAERQSYDLDECTYYISRSLDNGLYYLLERTAGSVVLVGRQNFCFRSLKDAIFVAQSQRYCLTVNCVRKWTSLMLNSLAPCFCVCTEISRFSQVNQTKRICPSVWSLQDLAAFYVRNHSYHFQKEIVRTYELPTVSKNRIRDIRSLKMFLND
jgi:hypothetical protein